MANGQGMATVTVCVTKDEKKALKQLALDRDMTVSDLFRMWLRESTGLETATDEIRRNDVNIGDGR